MTSNSNIQRVLIFSTAYHPFIGGAEVAIKEITDHLSLKFEFDLITARMDKQLPAVEKINNVTVYRVGSGHVTLDKLFLPFRGSLQAWKLQKTRDYTCLWGVMVTFGSGAGYIFNILRRLTGRKKIPIVLTLQEGDSEAHLKYKWFGLISLSWKLALRLTDFLTGISTFLLHRAEKNGYTGESKLVPNGVDVSLFSKEIDNTTKEELKKNLGKKENDVFLVTTGRLVLKNATDDIISALVHLPENISLIVIGKGVEGVRLQKQASDLNVSHRVKFLGFVLYEDIPKYLSVCDIFVRPSRSEGFGNSFIEAMATGLPVIATPVGGIVDFVSDKETGIFCSSDTPQSIVQAVTLLISDVLLRESIVRNAKKIVLERYDWEYIAKEMGSVFERIIV